MSTLSGQMPPGSTSQAPAEQQRRLPVNPRRTKVPQDQRKRVVRACNNCNVKRVRCTGKQPCLRCEKSDRECVYPPADVDKNAMKDEIGQLRAKCIEVDQLKETCAFYQQRLRDMGADESTTDLAFNADNAWPLARSLKASGYTLSNQVDPDRDGRMLSDDDNTSRYHGGTSGATFLDCLKRFMTEVAAMEIARSENDRREDRSTFLQSVGKYQTSDSRPLPDPTVDILYLPSHTDMRHQLAEFRYMLQDGNMDFTSGGIFWWGTADKPPVEPRPDSWLTTDANRHLAFYHVCFALSIVVGGVPIRIPTPQDGDSHYFKRALLLLGNPLVDTTRFTLNDVPVLALMAFYLIEVNRRDAAYLYVSLAVHIAMIHGAFRKGSNEASTRKFWTLYILDRWLSVLMGRPPCVPDEAVCLDMPAEIDGMPPAAGLYAHIMLAKISSYIVCETFKVAPRQSYAENSTSSMEQALDMLQSWHEQLPKILKMPHDLNHPDAACCMLHMEYEQLMLLTTRPILFAAVKQALSRRETQVAVEPHAQDDHIQTCTSAARTNIHLARVLKDRGRKLMQAGSHFVFNAAVVLLLNQFMLVAQQAESPFASPNTPLSALPDEDEDLLRFALETFGAMTKGPFTNYLRDCLTVLKDLRWLIDAYSNSSGSVSSGVAQGNGEFLANEYPPEWNQPEGLIYHGALCM